MFLPCYEVIIMSGISNENLSIGENYVREGD